MLHFCVFLNCASSEPKPHIMYSNPALLPRDETQAHLYINPVPYI